MNLIIVKHAILGILCPLIKLNVIQNAHQGPFIMQVTRLAAIVSNFVPYALIITLAMTDIAK